MKPVICVGAVATDRTYRMLGSPVLGSSNSARAVQHVGGVAHNVAANLAKLEVSAAVSTVLGADRIGRSLLTHLEEDGIDVRLVEFVEGCATAEFVALIAPDGELLVGVADMEIFDRLDGERFVRDAPHLSHASWVLLDCNPTAEYLAACLAHRRGNEYRLVIDGVSQEKIRRLPRRLDGVDLLFCNDAEAIAYLGPGAPASSAGRARSLRQRGAENVVLMRDAMGCVLATADQTLSYPAVSAHSLDTTGGGDALVAGTLYGLTCGRSMVEAVREGTLLAALTIESSATVAADLSVALFDASRSRLTDGPIPV